MPQAVSSEAQKMLWEWAVSTMAIAVKMTSPDAPESLVGRAVESEFNRLRRQLERCQGFQQVLAGGEEAVLGREVAIRVLRRATAILNAGTDAAAILLENN